MFTAPYDTTLFRQRRADFKIKICKLCFMLLNHSNKRYSKIDKQ